MPGSSLSSLSTPHLAPPLTADSRTHSSPRPSLRSLLADPWRRDPQGIVPPRPPPGLSLWSLCSGRVYLACLIDCLVAPSLTRRPSQASTSQLLQGLSHGQFIECVGFCTPSNSPMFSRCCVFQFELVLALTAQSSCRPRKTAQLQMSVTSPKLSPILLTNQPQVSGSH